MEGAATKPFAPEARLSCVDRTKTHCNGQKALVRLYRRLDVHDVVDVSVRPEPDAEFDECFAAIEKKIARNGGKPVYEWAISEA